MCLKELDEDYALALSMIKNNDNPICKEHLDFLIKRCKENNLNIKASEIVLLSYYEIDYYDMSVGRLSD